MLRFPAIFAGLYCLSPSATFWNRRRAVKSEGAACGIYITRHEPTQPMKDFAKQQGQFKPENFAAFDRLQIVTVQEILNGARMNLPLMEEMTKRAQKAKTNSQADLFGE